MSIISEYETCKKKLADAEKERAVLEDRRVRLIEQLNSIYHLNLETAREELSKMKVELADMERDFDVKYKEFEEKWNRLQ